jgi:hypothetical protein
VRIISACPLQKNPDVAHMNHLVNWADNLRHSVPVLLQEWLRISRVDLDRNAPLCRELRDFLTKVSSCGAPYQQWCTELRQEFPALVSFGVASIEFYPVKDSGYLILISGWIRSVWPRLGSL